MHITATVRTYIGPGSSRIAGQLLQEQGLDKVLVICDPNIEAAGLSSDILESLHSAGCSITMHTGIPADPSDTVIDQIAALCRKNQCQAVVAIGGGSCMDAGKCVAFLQHNPGHIRDYLLTPSRSWQKGIPLIAIPTTAGTGSEITFGAVVTDSHTGRKIGIGGQEFFAWVGLIDPKLTLSLPKAVSAATAMDAFAHAVETNLSSLSNPNSRLFSMAAVQLITENLESVLADGQDVERRQQLMYAAYLAGMSLNNTSCTLGHSIAHILGSQYHVPHGEACALTIPMTIEYFAPIFPQRIRGLAKSMGLSLPQHLSPQEEGTALADAIRTFNQRIGMRTLVQLGVSYEDLPEIARHILEENLPSMLRPNLMFRELTVEDLLEPLEREYILTSLDR